MERFLQHFPSELLSTNNRLDTYLGIFLTFEYLYQSWTGKRFSDAALDRSSALALLTPYFDDLTDETTVGFDGLPAFLSQKPAQVVDLATVCAYIFSTAGFSWDAHWQAVADAQSFSRLQKGGRLEEYELWDVLLKKGGSSVILGWHVIAEQSGGRAMKAASQQLGSFAQLLNDIFDVWKDREAGIETLVTNLVDLHQLLPVYERVFDGLIDYIKLVKSTKLGERKLIAFLVIGYALGKVALRQLVRLQRKNQDRFLVHQFSRKELVCDMALWKNQLALGWEILRYR